MLEIKLTKQATKQLKKINQSDKNTAKRIKNAILSLSKGDNVGDSLQGYANFYKVRVGKFRLIHTTIDDTLIIAIIEKRETIYATFKHLMANSEFLDNL